MPTIAYVDSFQHRVVAVNSWYEAVNNAGTTPNHGGGAITFDTGQTRTADHACSVKIAEDGAASTNFRKTIASKVVVGSFYFRVAAAPSIQSKMVFMTLTSGVANIGLTTSGFIYAKVGSGTLQTGAVNYADSAWHRLDWLADTTTGTATLDVQVDGTAITQATLALATANMTTVTMGSNTPADTLTFWASDWIFGHTSGDYPFGDHICLKLEINGTGTHSQGSGAFQDEAGNTTDAELLNSVDDAWDGTTPELSQTGEDFVRQTANDGAGYVEFTLSDNAQSGTVWGASLACLMASLDATTANNGETRLVDSAGTTLGTTGLIDPSGSATAYNGYRPFTTVAPSGGWSDTSLDACKVRFGFSTDAAPDVLLNSAIVEYVAAWSGSTPTDLVIQDAAHAHAADNLALVVDLAIQDATHAHAADNLALTQVHNLVVQDATHSHAADNVGLVVDLAIQDATHGHTADNVALTQVHNLTVADASHAHAADNLDLTQVHNLTVQDALHGHAADNLALTQVHNLAVQDALHAHAAENLDLTISTALVIQDALHDHTAENLALTQVHQLVVQDASHTQTADGLSLTQAHNLAIADALHDHAADNVVLDAGAVTDLVIQDGAHAHAADNIVITQAHQLVVQDASHAHRTDFWGPLVPIGGGDETVTYGDGTITLYDGPVGDFWSTADDGAMITRNATFIEASVDLGATLETNKRFLGLRGSDAAGAVMFMLLTNGSNSSYSTVWRDTVGGVAGYQGEPGGLPAFHRLTRGRITYDGTTASAYVSANGGAWTLVNERAISGLTKAFLGAGGGGGTHTASVFDNEIQLSQVHVLAIDDAFHGHTADHINDIGGDFGDTTEQNVVRLRRRGAPIGTG